MGRRAPAAQAANKKPTKESSVFKEEAEETIDLFDSRKYSSTVCGRSTLLCFY